MKVKEVFPIWKIENDVVINKNLDVSLIYRLCLPEVFTLSSTDYSQISDLFLKCIRLLEVGVVIHKQDWFFKEKKNDPYQVETFMSNANRQFFSEREILEHHCFLTFTKKYREDRRNKYRVQMNTPQEEITQSSNPAERFKNQVHQCVSILNSSKWFTLTLIKSNQLIREQGNPSSLLLDYLSLEHNTTSFSDIQFEPEMKIGSKYAKIYSLSSVEHFPDVFSSFNADDKYSVQESSIYHSWLYPLGLPIDQNHIINQYIEVIDAKKTFKKLERKAKRLKSFGNYGSGNKIKEKEILDFLNHAHTNHEFPTHVHINLLIWNEDKTHLNDTHLEIIEAFQKMDTRPRIVNAEFPFLFLAGILGNGGNLADDEKIIVTDVQAAGMLYLESPTRSNIGYHGIKLTNRVNGGAVLVDISEEPMKKGIIKNRNKIFVGDSGGGKSFFMNHLLRHYAEQGAHILIVDIGHSYKRLCELNQGLYFTYSDKMSINPFWIPLDKPMDVEKKESLLTLLFTLWKQKPSDKSPLEYSLLSEALTQYYENLALEHQKNKKILPTFNSFYEFIDQVYKKQLDTKELNNAEYFNITDFQVCLKKFYKGGEYQHLLNADQNANLIDQPFIVFELDSIADHPVLFPVVALIIMETFISKLRSLKGMKKIIVIEEAWKAIAKEGFDSFIKYLYKTCRKFYGEPIVVTQELEDLLENAVVKNTIIKQSDTLFVADLGKNTQYIDQLQKILGFSEHEKSLVLSLNKNNHRQRKYKEIFIRQSENANVYSVEVSPTEYACYTTEEKESLKVDQLNEFYGDLEYALKNYTKH